MDAMTVNWAKELARHNIRVAAIAPGFCRTAMMEAMPDKSSTSCGPKFLRDGWGTPRKSHTRCSSSSKTTISMAASWRWMTGCVCRQGRSQHAPFRIMKRSEQQ
ncbi:SDR family oxidoreductase [Modicisalibacter ilicicola]|uniref:SDR family oxidoreductase n=1 Tax=Modicisalibacter ilicicola TaxID=480814 RepID=UPI0009341CB0|nr:SDR family NAD(P)-dependent oxidoreductase [Halomonas ilicicola]